uniref:Exuperantia RNAse H-like domain-containing protein n=1 Tax=Amphimedon queenslandica TaxID=400682 RepID=A0A1X7U8R4_AMPQE
MGANSSKRIIRRTPTAISSTGTVQQRRYSGGKGATTTEEEKDTVEGPATITTPVKHRLESAVLTRSPLSSIRHHPSPLRPVPATPNNTPAKRTITEGIITKDTITSLSAGVMYTGVNGLKDSPCIKEEEVADKGMETSTLLNNNNNTNLPDTNNNDNDTTVGMNGEQEEANGTQTMDTGQPMNNTMDTMDTNNNPAIGTKDLHVATNNGIAMDDHSISDNVLPTAPVPSPPPPPLPTDMVLLFDLETTDLPLNSDICQVSVQVLGEERVWSRYLVPTKNIAPGASRVNGLKVSKNENGKRILLKRGQELPAKSYIDGLKEFYMYLCQLSRKHKKLHPSGRLILLAHNGRRYDAPILINALRKISVTAKKLNDISVCFSDSLSILRELQKENNPFLTNTESVDGGMGPAGVQVSSKVSLKLTSVYQHLFNEGFPAHDAAEDVKAMKRVLFEPPLQLPISVISNNTFKPEQV